MTFKDFFNLIPPCFRAPGSPGAVEATSLKQCLIDGQDAVIPYWTQRLFVLTALVSFFYVLYGGFMMVTSFGNEARFTDAKRTVTYALIGFIISILAEVIIYAFINLLGGTTPGS